MKIYRVDWVEPDGSEPCAWTGSRAEAVTKKHEVEVRLGKIAADGKITQMEVPEGKALLVKWLNENVKKL